MAVDITEKVVCSKHVTVRHGPWILSNMETWEARELCTELAKRVGEAHLSPKSIRLSRKLNVVWSGPYPLPKIIPMRVLSPRITPLSSMARYDDKRAIWMKRSIRRRAWRETKRSRPLTPAVYTFNEVSPSEVAILCTSIAGLTLPSRPVLSVSIPHPRAETVPIPKTGIL